MVRPRPRSISQVNGVITNIHEPLATIRCGECTPIAYANHVTLERHSSNHVPVANPCALRTREKRMVWLAALVIDIAAAPYPATSAQSGIIGMF